MKKIPLPPVSGLCLATLLLFQMTVNLPAQGSSQMRLRFANPAYSADNKLFSVQAEIKSVKGIEYLFGMNVRFFYDASLLQFEKLDALPSGYHTMGQIPRAQKGNEFSGLRLFDFQAAAAFVNTAIQVTNTDQASKIGYSEWVKLFSVQFKVLDEVDRSRPFAPSILWDIRENGHKGGFLKGEDGVVLTVLERDATTRQETAPVYVISEPFNWIYNPAVDLPYGKPAVQNALLLDDQASGTGGAFFNNTAFALFQNTPNPVMDDTMIGFVLPSSGKAKLSFTDIDGCVLKTIEQVFPAGYNTVKINASKDLNAMGRIVLYHLTTGDFSSPVKKMVVVPK